MLIAGIIASHAVMGYATFGSWTYQDVKEVTLSDGVEKIYAIAFLVLGGLFLMALFFLISGLLTYGSLDRKGPPGSSRIDSCGWASVRRLHAVDLAAPRVLPVRAVHARGLLGVGHEHRSGTGQRSDVVRRRAAALLRRPRRVVEAVPAPGTVGGAARWSHLVVLRWASAPPFSCGSSSLDSNQPLAEAWGWPEYLAMFGLGIAAARRGWLRPVPSTLARRCGIATITATAVMVIAVTTDLRGLEQDEYFGGRGLLRWSGRWPRACSPSRGRSGCCPSCSDT